jgi:hypothetical protein
MGDLLEGKVEVISYESECREDNEEDEEWKKFTIHRVNSRLKKGIGALLTLRLSGVVEGVLELTNVPKP